MKITLLVVGLIAIVVSTHALAEPMTDSQIRKELIQQSVENYSGNCPCPYFSDRAGRSCGRRSAYSKPGGYAPLCYDSDVSDEIVKVYRRRHKASN